MKVICINNRYQGGITNEYDNYLLLTVGKTYDVIDERSIMGYLLRNDEGESHFYDTDHFRLLSEVRDEKIDKLLE